jgi:hypothetical protein
VEGITSPRTHLGGGIISLVRKFVKPEPSAEESFLDHNLPLLFPSILCAFIVLGSMVSEFLGWLAALGVAENYLHHSRSFLQITGAKSQAR